CKRDTLQSRVWSALVPNFSPIPTSPREVAMWIRVISRMVMSLGIAAAMFGGAAAQNTVKIGMVMPLTGTLASAGKQVPHRRAYAGLILPRLLRFVRQPSPVQVLSPLNRLPTSTKLAAKPVRLVLAAQSA